MVGNNTPIFFCRDPSQFVDFIHSQKRNPQTALWDPNSFWDWHSLVPESVHQFMFVFSDRGIPASHRHINGYSSHTFKWVNAKNEGFWVKLHYKPEAGIKNLTPEEAQAVGAEDPDHARRDLFDTIASGQEVGWKAFYQIMTIEEGLKYEWDIFDITKVWPHGDHPLHPFGRLVLNRNPQNFFAETEQVAFSPANLVPGIEPSMDKFLQARLFSYSDTQRHRIGGNFMQLPINCPYSTRVHNQQRDGPMCIISQGAQPTYYPNSVDKIEVVPEAKMHSTLVSGTIDRHPYNNDDFAQPRAFYNKVLKSDERERLVNNIVNGLSAARKDIQDRLVAIYRKVDQDFGDRVEKGLAAKKPKHVMQKLPGSV